MNEAASLTSLLLQKCPSITSLRKARQLHALIFASSTPFTYNQPFLHNNIISMYMKCGSLVNAHQVFDKMPQRNFISYNTIISAYARYPNFGTSSVRMFALMRYQCFVPNGATFISLLQSASGIRDWFLGLTLHCLIMKYGFLFDVHVQTALVGFYSSIGELKLATEVFGNVLAKDAYSWNCIISGHVKNNKLTEGLSLFRNMVGSGVMPTEFSYSMVLSACSRLSDYAFGRLTHAHVIVTGVPLDLPLQNAMVDMYSSCGDSQSAFRVFNEIQNPDLVSWNSMMAGYAENGEGDKAMDLFVRLLRHVTQKPDEYTFAAVISANQEYPVSRYGEVLHTRVIVSGLDKSVYVGSPLISMYFNNGRIESAEKVFHSIPKKDVVLWTEMMAGYTKALDGENAVKVFFDMWKEGHNIDDFALSCALSACADLATLKQGEMLHCLAIKTRYDSKMSVCGSLIDTYAKNGSLKAAESIFSMVKDPDLKCWNSMISGYGHHGKGEEAMKLFDEILIHGPEPDLVTYISLLSACSHSGLVTQGKHLWNRMKENDLSPGLKHYSCMVSLLCRAGLLEEAVDIINESEYGENHLELWRIVLSSSVSSKNLSVGVHAAGKILKVDAHDSATYTLLSNLYAAVGKWEGVMEIQKQIRGLMLEKDPGLSWVETVEKLEVL
ncbi:pentatricopeptide repeat-containing protein At3g50420-like [Silene latifolia]|uniref:pentatricopeptide repeat-containing protein At3g50420-like n=1 Tax=Silene latifolia TaxID=37657 RepID=UPI003D77DA0A